MSYVPYVNSPGLRASLPGTKSSTGPGAVPKTNGLTIGDLLGSFANYNALTGPLLPGSEGNMTGGVDVPNPSAPSAPSAPSMDSNYYLNLIQNDPLYKQLGADLSAQGVGDAQQTGAGVLRAMVDRGVVPDLTSAAAQLGLSPAIVNWIRNNVDLGNAAGLAAQANKAGVSQEANLEHTHALNMGSIADQLAARGLLRSGANAFLTGEEERGYTNAQHSADQQLADYISGAYSAFAKNEQARQAQLGQGASDAMQRAMQLFGSVPPPTPSAPPPPAPPGPSSTPTTPTLYPRPSVVRLPGVTAV